MNTSPGVAAAKWFPLLEHSTQEVFEIMLGSKLEPATPEPVTGVEFTAMVGLAGSLCGVLTVRCGQQSANLIASTMLNLPPAQASEHAWDALGEVANMVAGNFKNKIDGVSDKCLLSVPTVITGAGYSFHALADAAPLELWFRFQGGLLQVTLEIQD